MSYLLLIIAFIILHAKISSLERRFEETLRGGRVVPSPQPPPTSTQPIPPRPAVHIFPTPRPAVPPLDPIELSHSERPIRVEAEEPILIRNFSDRSKQSNQRTEFAVGGKLFTGIGIFSIFLAVAFFLNYAFENNLISESARIILGLIFGLIIVGAGRYLRRKYVSYGNTLVGGGVGILYLTIYAAYGFYQLISLPTAFIILFIITAFSSLISVRYDSKALTAWSLTGAFLIPFILYANLSVHAIFSYLLVVNGGILLISRFKSWPEITIGGLAVSSLIYLQWLFNFYETAIYLPTLAYSTALFALYFGASFLNFAFRDRRSNATDATLVYLIPAIYFLLNLVIVTGQHNVALFALLIGLFYIIMAIIVRAALAGAGELAKFSNALILIASPFIATSIALYFERGSTITIALGLQATIMVLVGSLLNSSANRIAGLVLSMIVAFKFFTMEARLPAGAKMLFNERSITFLCLFFMFLILWRVYVSYVANLKEATEDEKKAGRFVGAAGVFIVIFLWLSLEVNDFVRQAKFYLPILWYVYAVLMVSLAFIAKERSLRYLSYVTMALALGYTITHQWILPASLYQPFFNIRTITTVAVVCAHLFILQLWKLNPTEVSAKEIDTAKIPLILSANVIVLWAGSLEILQYYASSLESTKRVVLSAFWLVYGLVGLGVGISKRSSFARYFSIILFGITIFKIFLYDTANLSDLYRFASFITLGLILLIAGFAYHKYKARIAELI